MPRRADGSVPVRHAIAALGIGSSRAYRLLQEANLLAPSTRLGTTNAPGTPAPINGVPVPAREDH